MITLVVMLLQVVTEDQEEVQLQDIQVIVVLQEDQVLQVKVTMEVVQQLLVTTTLEVVAVEEQDRLVNKVVVIQEDLEEVVV